MLISMYVSECWDRDRLCFRWQLPCVWVSERGKVEINSGKGMTEQSLLVDIYFLCISALSSFVLRTYALSTSPCAYLLWFYITFFSCEVLMYNSGTLWCLRELLVCQCECLCSCEASKQQPANFSAFLIELTSHSRQTQFFFLRV